MQTNTNRVPAMGDARRLLAAIAGDTSVTFQTFDDTDAKRGGLVKVLHGTFDQHSEALAALNHRGASVNFMVNQGDGRGRRAENVRAVRALFVDLDGAPLEPVLRASLRPHAVIETSPGKYHAYWFADGVSVTEFSGMQRLIAHRFMGDAKVTDLARVMRLPGFLHQKGQAVLSSILLLEDMPPYAACELRAAFGSPDTEPTPKTALKVLDGTIPVGARNETLFKLARGFVNKGHDYEQVLSRMRVVNQSKCVDPLGEDEVAGIVRSAVAHGPGGYLNLPLPVFDSPAYRRLSHAARTVAAAAYRRYNGENNGNISLSFRDFREEFKRRETFYRARSEVIEAGLIRLTRRRQYDEWAGRKPDLFEVALSPPSGPKKVRIADN